MSGKLHAISMPKWGMTMTEGTVAGWLFEEGDRVTAQDEIVEIETTKITNVMEAHAGGVFARRIVEAGATVPVGTLLGVVADGDASDDEIDRFVADFTPPADVASDGASGDEPRIVAAGDHRINVLSTGESGDHVVLLHGFGGDLNGWMFNQPELAGRYRVHALDLPGHGASDHDVGSGAVPDLANAVVATLDALEIEKAHLVGHSLGGAIALYLAIKHSDRVASATLVCPGGLGPDINMEFIDGFVAADRRKPMKQALALLFADDSAVKRQMIEESLKYKRLDGVEDVLATIRDANFTDCNQAGGMREALGSLKLPVQVIWGRDDQIIPAAHGDGLPSSVAVMTIDDAGHMPHMEQPRAFNAAVLGFLDNHGTGG